MDLSTEYNNILEEFTLSEILEYNDITEVEALELIAEHCVIDLPDPKPLNFND